MVALGGFYISPFANMVLQARKIAVTCSAPELACRHMMTSQFRSDRGKTRKREISRDFSRFFDPEFFRNFVDAFGHFGSVAGFEPPHTFRSISKNFSFKKYLQSCRCNNALDRFGLPHLKCLQNCGIIDKKVWDVPNNMTKESIK